MSDDRPTLTERRCAVLAKVAIGPLVERHVKLSGSASSRNRRGKCPFHQGNSASFSVKDGAVPGTGFAHCFGCPFHGNAIDFLAAIRGLSFIDALAELEREVGLSDVGASGEARGPVAFERKPRPPSRRPERVMIESIDMGRWIWKHAAPHREAVTRYFSGRGVPAAVLTARRMSAFRYLAECPCVPWEAGKAPPRDGLTAPAVIGMMRVPEMMSGPTGTWLEWHPVGVHVTYLAPGGDATMIRRKPWAKPDDADPLLPKRRMLGPAGGAAVLLEEYRPGLPLYVGEGNETVLSGMALAGAGDDAVGLAVLSLDNLQGFPRLWRGGIWPLHAMVPDADRRPLFTVPGHRGAVTGLIDSDMSPLRKQKVVERKGGPIVDRAITGAERARICGELFVKGWRAAGASPVEAVRAPLGMDFNDAARAAMEAV